MIRPHAALSSLLLLTATVGAQEETFLRDNVLAQMKWRTIGPSTFSGRIVDIAVHPGRPSTIYAATGSGGLWKTVNRGVTWQQQFHDQPVVSIGDIAIAPSDPDVIYLGTGEANNQRSSYWGDGIYRSTDAGATWEHIGLRGTDHIGRIVVHPNDPNLLYVAALGALYRPNPERGVYRSADGGETWELVQHVDEDTGCVDLAMDPNEPGTLYAASYQRRRRAWNFAESGPGSAIWKTTDGGDSWSQLDGGLPDGKIGRIGLAVAANSTVYAIVENANPAPPRPRRVEGDGAGDIGDREPGEAQDGGRRQSRRREIGGEVYRSTDGGATWENRCDRPVAGSPHYYYGQIRIDPNDPEHLWTLGVRVSESTDGGTTWETGFGGNLHVDHHALWIDPTDSEHALLGNDGGISETYDGGDSWRYYNDLPLAQFYTVAVDLRQPYTVYGGTQDNGSWGMPSRSKTNESLDKHDAFRINGGDGFFVQVDPRNPDILYSESQFGSISRIDLASGARTGIRPRAAKGSPPLRFNWSSPILLSPHNPETVYFGSQYLHKSVNRGDDWQEISGDLSTADPDKIAGNVPHCTLTTIAESPLQQGLLWVGTDDGRVWMTRDDGGRWHDLGDRFPEEVRSLWVSRVEASPSDADVAYVSFTGYREDIRSPYLFRTDDGGETFRPIHNDLPEAPINVVREHPRAADVLFVGTEFGVYTSLDAGASWTRLGDGLPTTPVHDLLVHPREDDLVIGTHGLGFWILDITAMADMNARTLSRPFHAFAVRDGHQRRSSFANIRYAAARGWTADQAEARPVFRYFLAQDGDETVQIEVFDATGRRVFNRRGDHAAGLHEMPMAQPRGGAQGRRGNRRSDTPGEYRARFTYGDTVVERSFRIHPSD